MSVEAIIGEPTALPDILPEVSFDIRLGKSFDYVDFDYVAYNAHLARRGQSEEQIGNSSVTFRRLGMDMLSRAGGATYNTTSGSIVISVPHYDAEHRVNRRLVHETEHKIDNDLGQIGEGSRALYAVAYGSGAAALTAEAWRGAANLSLWLDHNNLMVPSTTTLERVVGIGLTASIMCYGIIPTERNARKAARENSEAFVRLVPKKHKTSLLG